MNTSIIHTLPSGLEVEVRRMKTKHQDWLINHKKSNQVKRGGQSKAKEERNIDHIVADCLLRIGDMSFEGMQLNDKQEIVQRMYSWDFKYLVMLIRFFTCDVYFEERYKAWEEWKKYSEMEEEEVDEFEDQFEPHIFNFKYEYESNGRLKKKDYEIEISMWDFDLNPGKAKCENIKEIDTVREIVLPVSKETVRFNLLTVKDENARSNKYVKEGITLNDLIIWRNPKKLITPKKDGAQPIFHNVTKADLGEWEILDAEALRKAIDTEEGKMDTVILLNPPEDSDEQERISVDLMGLSSFFIPSGVV